MSLADSFPSGRIAPTARWTNSNGSLLLVATADLFPNESVAFFFTIQQPRHPHARAQPLLPAHERAAAAEYSLAWQGAVDVSVGCEHCAGPPDAGVALLPYTLPGAALAVQPPLSLIT
jgi:hypothetical protein